jgi:hypothetical protein
MGNSRKEKIQEWSVETIDKVYFLSLWDTEKYDAYQEYDQYVVSNN